MAEPRKGDEKAKSGLKEGETPSTDSTRKPDRPTEEEDVFGGVERTKKNEGGAKSDHVKP